jgi:hypothetical protein
MAAKSQSVVSTIGNADHAVPASCHFWKVLNWRGCGVVGGHSGHEFCFWRWREGPEIANVHD